MTAVTLACPLCAGNIQIDTAMAGQQVACPLCYGAIMLPPAEMLLQFAAPQYGIPMPYEAPALASEPVQQAPSPDMIFSITCPACANALQVTAAMSGQQVGCPYCTTPIVVPPLQNAPAPSYYQAEQPEFAPQPVDVSAGTQAGTAPEHHDYDINAILPPGAEPVAPTSSSTAPAAPRRSPPKTREPSEADLLPPSRAQTVPASKPANAPAGPPSADRFPPGFGGTKPSDARREERAREEKAREEKYREERLPPRKDRTQPIAEKPSPPKVDERMPPRRPVSPPEEAKADASALPQPPKASQEPQPPAIDDLLPPGALPPSAASSAVAAPEPTRTTSPPSAMSATQPAANIDAILPPGALPPGAEMLAAASPPTTTPAQPTAPAPSRIDQLLPPGAANVNAAAVEQTTPKQKASVAEALLPPGAAGPTPNTLPGAQVPLPVTQPGPLRPVLAPGQKKPSQGLGSLKVEGRAKEDESLAEIKKLSAEEKAKRRFRRNLVMWTVCVLILFAVFYFMAR